MSPILNQVRGARLSRLLEGVKDRVEDAALMFGLGGIGSRAPITFS